MTKHVGVAISGGGHRATLWGLGAMRYLVAAGKASEVGTITSVSGGSITNGVLAQSIDDWDALTAEDFDTRTRPLVRNIVRDGLFHWGPATNVYLRTTLGVLAAGGVVLLGALVWTAVTGLRWGSGALAVVALALLTVGFWLFTQRSLRVDGALARTHFSTEGRPTLLGDLAPRTMLHIFCATELQEGRHFYFSPRFVYTYGLGVGRTGGLRLSTAVQASACLPGAFAARRLATAELGFTAPSPSAATSLPVPAPLSEVVLVDGGVYDNMGEQWFASAGHRSKVGPGLPEQNEIDEVLVVNASGLDGPRKLGSKLAVVRELGDLAACSGVMYAQTTSVRRVELVALWNANERLRRGQRGVIAQITQDPCRIARDVAEAVTPTSSGAFQATGARAKEALDLLEAAGVDWKALAAANAAVATTLGTLTAGEAARLLYGSWAVLMTNSHISLGYPLLPLPTVDSLATLVGETLPPDVLPTAHKLAAGATAP